MKTPLCDIIGAYSDIIIHVSEYVMVFGLHDVGNGM